MVSREMAVHLYVLVCFVAPRSVCVVAPRSVLSLHQGVCVVIPRSVCRCTKECVLSYQGVCVVAPRSVCCCTKECVLSLHQGVYAINLTTRKTRFTVSGFKIGWDCV
jgi:hypothetical protein